MDLRRSPRKSLESIRGSRPPNKQCVTVSWLTKTGLGNELYMGTWWQSFNQSFSSCSSRCVSKFCPATKNCRKLEVLLFEQPGRTGLIKLRRSKHEAHVGTIDAKSKRGPGNPKSGRRGRARRYQTSLTICFLVSSFGSGYGETVRM